MKSRTILLLGTLSANLLIAVVVYFLSGGKSVAETWYDIDANSLVGLQALVEQRLDPNPEDPTLSWDVVFPVINNVPAWLAVLVLLMVLDALPLALLLRAARRRAAAAEATTVERSE